MELLEEVKPTRARTILVVMVIYIQRTQTMRLIQSQKQHKELR